MIAHRLVAWCLRGLVLWGLLCGSAIAQTPGQVPFDHLSTGFALTDAHARAPCESCHRNGQLRGTPRDCASCHVAGRRQASGNTVVPARHLPTAQACDSCHNTRSFAGARFNHVGVAPGSCAGCHNGVVADGKPGNHLPTVAACDSCHRPQGWLPATGFDHAAVVPGSCQTCHDGHRATGRPVTHMPTPGAAACDACHRTRAWVPANWTHTQVAVSGQCASCHTGGYPPAGGKPTNHIPYTSVPAAAAANCDTCHRSGFASWSGARLHASLNVATGCASCHSGAYPPAEGKPGNAMHAAVTSNCETCHKSTSNWAAAQVDHSKFNASTACTSCHNGSSAPGKPANHIPVAATSCYSCHQTTTWTPTKWNHTQVPVTAQCATCHSGAYPPAEGKPNNATHAAVTGSCDSCHKSTSNWAAAQVDHSKFNAATACTSCHNGSSAPGKPANHIPVAAASCYSCHQTNSWTPTKWNHTQVPVTAQCATCHSGAYPPAEGKPNNATHAAVTGSCDSCHKSTTTWSNVNFTHSAGNAVGTGTCDSCHNGGTASGKPAGHVPVPAGPARCDSCHKSQAGWGTAVSMNHAAVASASCKSCHGGAYAGQGATAKPINHIPEVQLLAGASMDCKACHSSTSSFGAMTMNHNNSVGNGAGWCKACHASGTNYLGDMEHKSLTHEKSTGVTDCSQSGCHRPLGNKGQTYKEWD